MKTLKFFSLFIALAATSAIGAPTVNVPAGGASTPSQSVSPRPTPGIPPGLNRPNGNDQNQNQNNPNNPNLINPNTSQPQQPEVATNSGVNAEINNGVNSGRNNNMNAAKNSGYIQPGSRLAGSQSYITNNPQYQNTNRLHNYNTNRANGRGMWNTNHPSYRTNSYGRTNNFDMRTGRTNNFGF